MDMKEASAMTEASGLMNEQSPPSQEATMRWVEQLRKVTIQAPLQALFCRVSVWYVGRTPTLAGAARLHVWPGS